MIPLLEGGRPLSELISQAQSRLGPAGPIKLAQLLAELGERGLLEGIDSAVGRPGRAAAPASRGCCGRGRARWRVPAPPFDRIYRAADSCSSRSPGRLALLAVGLGGSRRLPIC